MALVAGLKKPPRLLLLALACCLVLLVPSFVVLRGSFDTPEAHNALWAPGSVLPSRELLHGPVLSQKLGNETARAELGRAGWRLLHTMAARYPDKPTDQDKEAYSSFLYMFARVYPCGECAKHFQELLHQHPPQTASRSTASLHLCYLHNIVNERLGKNEFDCSSVEGLYDCGCREDEKESNERRDELTGHRLEGG